VPRPKSKAPLREGKHISGPRKPFAPRERRSFDEEGRPFYGAGKPFKKFGRFEDDREAFTSWNDRPRGGKRFSAPEMMPPPAMGVQDRPQRPHWKGKPRKPFGRDDRPFARDAKPFGRGGRSFGGGGRPFAPRGPKPFGRDDGPFEREGRPFHRGPKPF